MADHPKWQTAEEFLARPLPTKDPLVDGLLWRRDLIALAGRRRHGKTTFVSNLAIALATGPREWLGYDIPEPRRVLFLPLEDDAGEVQYKLRRIVADRAVNERLRLMTREDFWAKEVQIGIGHAAFLNVLRAGCREHEPDLVILDNMAHLVSGDYNRAPLVHQVGKLAFDLSVEFNCAVLIPAHPRKRSQDKDQWVTIRTDPEAFFEEVMGSSHFINSFGSLWGIERNFGTDFTDFVGGAQRFTGHFNVSVLEKTDDDWFEITGNRQVLAEAVLSDPTKREFWSGLGRDPLSFEQAEIISKGFMSRSAFLGWWWGTVVRLGMVKQLADGKWQKTVEEVK